MRHEEHIEVVRDLYCDTVQNPGCVVEGEKNGAIKIGKKETEYCIKRESVKASCSRQMRNYTRRRETVSHFQSGFHPDAK